MFEVIKVYKNNIEELIDEIFLIYLFFFVMFYNFFDFFVKILILVRFFY